MLPHRVDHHAGDLGQERLFKADLAPETRRAAQNQAQDVLAPLVPRHHAIADQKGDRPPVVGDHAIRDHVCLALGVGMPQQLLGARDDRLEQVGAIVGRRPLQHRDDPLKARAGVHVHRRQRLQGLRVDAVVLDENQVPQLDKTPTVAVDLAHVPGHALLVAEGRPAIDADLAVGTARPGVGHLPKVVAPAKVQDVAGIDAGLGAPKARRFLVGRQLAQLVLEHGGVQPVPGQPPNAGQQLPGPGDGLFFVIVAKGPVAQHLEKGVVRPVTPHLFQVVVLARNAHALLRVRRARVLARSQAQEYILELVHPGVGEQQSRIVDRDQGRAGHDRVPALTKKVEKTGANLGAGPFFHLQSSSGPL